MNIFFDVDYTILGLDDTLRPGTREVFQKLKDDGHTIYLWSGQGIRWEVVRQHQLEPYVTDCFEKPLQQYKQGLDRLGLKVKPDFVIDDYPEVVSALGGMWVPAYFMKRNADTEMERVYRAIQEFGQDGHSTDGHFRQPT